MADHAPFLFAIAAHPEEDAPRLIYADWLEEQGQTERAEFIRVQCELAQMRSQELATWDLARLQDLEDRERELLDSPAALGENPLHDVARQIVYRRGMIDEARMSLNMYLYQVPRALRFVPLRRLTLTHLEPDQIPTLARTRALAKLQGLALASSGGADIFVDLEHLFASEFLDCLEKLTLVNVYNSNLYIRQGIPVPQAVRELALCYTDISHVALRFLAASLCLRLRKLHLQARTMDDMLLAALGSLLEGPRPEILVLREERSTNLGPRAWGYLRSLLSAPALHSLRELHLSCPWMDDEGIRLMAGREPQALAGLEKLRLESPWITHAGIRELATSPNFPSLKCLDLRGMNLEIMSIRALAKNPLLNQLRFLALEGAHLHRQAVETLLVSRYWNKRTALLLANVPFVTQDLRKLRTKFQDRLSYCRVLQRGEVYTGDSPT